jgi:hypothetical protein
LLLAGRGIATVELGSTSRGSARTAAGAERRTAKRLRAVCWCSARSAVAAADRESLIAMLEKTLAEPST